MERLIVFLRKLPAATLPAVIIAVLAASLSGGPAATQVRDPAAPAEPPLSEIERFCGNIADEARDRRYTLQVAELDKLRTDVDERIQLLEAKRAEYEAWVLRRERFMKQAEENVVQIYSRMRADAAALQLTELRAEMAASILMKLDPRVASVILNEMDMKAAASLTTIMVTAARPKDPS
jgi:flagellar motility protein MotE (MotC chaperone)